MKRIVIAVALSCSLVALAEPCARPKEATSQGVAAQSDEARLAFLSKLLLEESARARTWTLGWGATYGLMTVAQLTLIPVFAREEPNDDPILVAMKSPLVGRPTQPQADMYWGALSTAVGVAFTLLDPPEVLDGGPRFAQRVRGAAPTETCALIAEGERMLEAGAEHERAATQWYIHAGNVLFNVGLGLVLGLGYGRWTSGLMNLGVGTAIGEATVLTAPMHLVSGWKAYRQGESPPAVTFHLVPTAGPGLGLLVRF